MSTNYAPLYGAFDSVTGALTGFSTVAGTLTSFNNGALLYQTTYDASSNTPPLVAGTKGSYWKVSNPGTQFGFSLNTGDLLVDNGTTFDRINGAALAQSAFTDTTNAANITAGTLPAARLPSIPSTALSDGAQLNTNVANSVKYAANFNAATNVVSGVPGVTSLSNANPGSQTSFVNTAPGTTSVSYLGASITSLNFNDEVLWNTVTGGWQVLPFNAPSILGIYANVAAIPYPASAWNGYSVSVGGFPPYVSYTSNGSAWVRDITDVQVGVAGGVVAQLGTFNTAADLQTAYPAASNAGARAQVGTSAPYMSYTCDGVNWDAAVLNLGAFASVAALQAAYPPGSNTGSVATVSGNLYASNGSAWLLRVQSSTDLIDGASLAHNPVSITGSNAVGSTLTAALATGWSATGFQWTRNGSNISGATSSTYTLITADGSTTVGVIATGLVYAPTGLSIAAAPAVAPTITSAPVLNANVAGSAVTWTPGSMSGNPSPTATFDLKKNGTVVSSGATSGSYTSTTAGDILVVTQKATTSAGTATPVDSNSITVSSNATLRAAAATNYGPQSLLSVKVASATTVDIYSRVAFILGANIPSIVLGFPNWALVPAAGVTNPGNSFTITQCAIEIGSSVQQVFFGGSTSTVVANGSNVLSDALAASAFSLQQFAQGTTGYIRLRMTFSAPATDKMPYSGALNNSAAGGQLWCDPTKVNFTNGVLSTGVYAYSMTNGGVNGTDVLFSNPYRPIVLGAHTGPTIGFWGDSKTFGTGDSPPGAVPVGGMSRTLLPTRDSATGAKSGINFGNPSGYPADPTTAVGAASLTSLTYWYQFVKYAVVGYGTNNASTTAQASLHSQIRSIMGAGTKIIQRSLTPRSTSLSVTLTGATASGTTVTATASSTAGMVNGNTYTIAGATGTGSALYYNGSFVISNLTSTSFQYTATGGSPAATATGTLTAQDQFRTTAGQTAASGWSSGGTADTFEVYCRGLPASDANMTYYQSLGERSATSGTGYWLWKSDGTTAYLETGEGLHESAQGYEDNIGTTGSVINQSGTTSNTLRALVQALP